MKTFIPPANGYALRSLFTLRQTKLYALRKVWIKLVSVLLRSRDVMAESANLKQAIKANLKGWVLGAKKKPTTPAQAVLKVAFAPASSMLSSPNSFTQT